MGESARLSVVSGGVARLADVGVRCGLDRGQLLAEARIDPALLEQRDTRLPVDYFTRLWQLLGQKLPGRVLALDWIAAFQPSDMGVIGYLLVQASDLGDMLDTFCRYWQLVNQGLDPKLERGPSTARVTFSPPAALLATQHAPEAMVATLVAMVRRLVDPQFVPLAVHLPHPRTERSPALEKFIGRSLEHGAPRVAVELPASLLERRIAGADPLLATYLRNQADEMLAHIDVASAVSHDAARRIAARLSTGEPDQGSIAKQMGMSERTLQRRLRDEGTTFNKLLEDARRTIAIGYLADSRLAAYEVSFLLGYAEPTTFFRAFKRWTGKTPQQYRASAA